MTNIKIAIGQIRCITGDLKGNTERIIENIKKAKGKGADLIIFPELAITGYCCGALFNTNQFITDQLNVLNETIGPESFGINVILGFVSQLGVDKSGFPILQNSAVLLRKNRNSKLEVYSKRLLANSDHHEDLKYFKPGIPKTGIFRITTNSNKRINIGTLICEDAWNITHTEDLVKESVSNGAEVIVVLNQSYFYYGKQKIRYDLFSNHAKENNVPIVTVNSVGVGDIVKNIVIFDGGSMAFNRKGEMVTECRRFDEDFKIVDFNAIPIKFNEPKKYDEIYRALVFEQDELFGVLQIPRAQVHLSGGIDSALVGTLVIDAMGPDHTFFITNPSKNNKKELFNLVDKLCKRNLNHRYLTQNIQKSVDAIEKSMVKAHKKLTGNKLKLKDITLSTIHATLRSVFGLASANEYNTTGIVATGNHTEIVEGWANFHDIGSIGVHSLIGDLTKVEVFQFARWLNENIYKVEIIPKELYDGTIKPAAELVDASEDPFDYFVRSGIDAEIIRNRKTPNQLIKDFKNQTLTKDFFPFGWDGLSVYKLTEKQFTEQVNAAYKNSKRSVFKAAQAAPIVIISPRSRGFSNRETIINWYLK